MHEEDLHIIFGPDKEIPEPEIPVDEAWNNMTELLDKAMPLSPSKPPSAPINPSGIGGAGIIGSSQFWTIVVSTLIVAGALIWGVVSITERAGMQDKITESITEASSSTRADTLMKSITEYGGTGSFAVASEPKTTKDIEEIINEESKILSEGEPNEFKQPGFKSHTEPESKPAVSSFTDQPSEIPSVIVPLKPVKENPAILAEDMQAQPDPVREDILTDSSSAILTKMKLLAQAPDSMKMSTGLTNGENLPANPAVTGEQDKSKKNPEAREKRSSSGVSKNLRWKIGFFGNTGAVVQQGRYPNTCIGAMATGGLWHEKIKGGIESGMGYESYEDYGSVTENIRIDSIPIDSLGNFAHLDSSRVTAYKYRYHYLQVPLFLTKELLSKGKFSFEIKTGPLVGFMIADRKTLDYTSGPDGGELLSIVNADFSRLKISWQWQILPQFNWNFSERLSLSVDPYCIFFLNKLYNKNNRPPETPFGFGISAGLIYRFR